MRISIYKEPGDKIPVDKATCGETDPILWCRSGEYRIIPVEIVKNAIDAINMYIASDGKRTPPELHFYWSQGIPISNLAGRALVGE